MYSWPLSPFPCRHIPQLAQRTKTPSGTYLHTRTYWLKQYCIRVLIIYCRLTKAATVSLPHSNVTANTHIISTHTIIQSLSSSLLNILQNGREQVGCFSHLKNYSFKAQASATCFLIETIWTCALGAGSAWPAVNHQQLLSSGSIRAPLLVGPLSLKGLEVEGEDLCNPRGEQSVMS